MTESCFLAKYSDRPCSGRLIRAHLLPRQLILREVVAERSAAVISDPRSYVLACGGPMGNAGHHGELDVSRTIRIPRDDLPAGLEDLAEEVGLVWWLDREYGR